MSSDIMNSRSNIPALTATSFFMPRRFSSLIIVILMAARTAHTQRQSPKMLKHQGDVLPGVAASAVNFSTSGKSAVTMSRHTTTKV